MLPIGNRPIVDYVVEDCFKAGITDIYFVVAEGSTQLQQFYSDNAKLNAYLSYSGKEDMLKYATPPRANFHYIEQPQNSKYGTAIPVGLAAEYIKEQESVVVLMGDDFIYNHDGSSEVARLIQSTPENGNAMLGVHRPAQELSRYGVIDLNDLGEFVRIVEKPAPGYAPSDLINVSKYVLNHDLLMAIKYYADVDISGEYFITDPINQYVVGGGSVKVVPVNGQYLDGGSVDGWFEANKIVLQK